jgi:ATP-dependent RNA helicase RhlE
LLHFSSTNLSKPILDAVAEEGYDTPTPIQAKAIPHALEGRDILGCAQTGTGKTAAFALPVLHRLHAAPVDMTRRGPVLPRALVLSPTRELASQIGESFDVYGRNTGLRHVVIYGGVSQHHQVRGLQRGVDIIVATPGRLMDLMEQGHVDLREIEIFILDEADRMLDMGFIQPIRRIAAKLRRKRQTLLFSATMPKSIMHLADSLLHNPVKVSVAPVASTAALIEQSVYMAPKASKPALLEHLLAEHGVERALVFTRTKHGADKLTRTLNRSGVTSTAIHGNKGQNQRQRALDAFRTGRCRVLVATDVAARGLDVDGVTHVFNFDLPNEPEAYVHRIGRTGRAGASGVAISFCDRDERGYLRAIERLTGKQLVTIAGPNALQSSAIVLDEAPAPDSHAPRGRNRSNRGGPIPSGQRRSRSGGRGRANRSNRSRSGS